MAEGKIRVKFEAKGDKGLIDAIRRLNQETKKLTGSTKKYDNTTKGTTRNNKRLKDSFLGLGNTLATLRSKLLLAAFAFKSVQGVINFGRRALDLSANFEALETRLVSMTGSVEKASEMMAEFRDIAATTPFAVQDVVEAGVQLRAFGVNAQEMIKPVTDLAAFMGTTATEAASALGRAFAGGAGAADILRERGILQLIKDSQGIEDLSKTTLPEFREALESALIDPTAGIVGATDKLSKTTAGAFSNMGDAVMNFMATASDESGFTDFMKDAAIAATNILNMTTQSMKGEKSAFGQLKDDIDSVLNTGDYDRLIEVTIKAQDELFKLKQAGDTSSSAFTTLRDSVRMLTQQTVRAFDPMKNFEEVQRNLAAQTTAFTEAVNTSNDTIEMSKVQVREVNENRQHEIPLLEQINGLEARHGDTIKKSAQSANILSHSLVSLSKGNKQQTIMALRLAQASAIADSVAGSAKAFGQGGIAGYFTGVALLATMMARIQTIQQQISQAESFETGGLIGGRRHSQGGTIIEAERGEFVMSRNAVNTIGVENLNRMNQGQSSGGGATIVINNPIVNSDFVENDFADLMREAVRKGADFGIS